MKVANIGDKVIINKNLKSGRVIGKVTYKGGRVVYHVRLIDSITKKITGDFVYTGKQLTVC